MVFVKHNFLKPELKLQLQLQLPKTATTVSDSSKKVAQSWISKIDLFF